MKLSRCCRHSWTIRDSACHHQSLTWPPSLIRFDQQHLPVVVIHSHRVTRGTTPQTAARMVNRGAQCRPEYWPLHSGTGRRVVPVRLPIPLFNTFTTPASHADTGDTAAQHRRPGVRKLGSRRIQTSSAVGTARSDCDQSARTTWRVVDFPTAPLPRSAGSFGRYSSTAPVMPWAGVFC